MSSPAPSDNPFTLLLAVQDLDTAIAQHEHRKATLPARRELDEVLALQTAQRRRAAELTKERDEIATRLSHSEEQTAAVVARRKALENRLYSARGVPGRDLAAIESEVAQLAIRLGELEDEEMALLEEQEPVDEALEQTAAELRALSAQSDELVARIAETTGVIDAELAELRSARKIQASLLPEGLARRYEDLRARLGGIGAARLLGDRCDGCHLSLPSVEVDRIRHLPDDAVVTCDQCGRILVRPSLAGG